MPLEKIDALVIGAGAVGLAVSRALAQAGRETIVVERESGIGQGVSSRNSEVTHAGREPARLKRFDAKARGGCNACAEYSL